MQRSEPHNSLGEQIAQLRRDRGLTQEQLADRSGVNVGTIRKLERGERDSAALSTLHKLAAPLGVTTMALFRPQPQFSGIPDDGERDDLHALRRVLQPARPRGEAVQIPDDEPPDLDALARSVLSMRRMLHGDGFVTAIAMAPALISESRAAVAAEPSREALRVLAGAYNTAGSLLIHLRKEDLAYHTLGLAMAAAREADDPALVASAVAGETWLLIRQGRLDDAEAAALATAEAIEPSFTRAPAQQLASWGWLMLGASAAAIRNNRPDVAAEAMSNARAAAVRVDAAHDYRGDGTPFGTAVVDWRTCENAIILGDAESALRVAQRAGRPAKPSSGYHRFRLDVAAAHLAVRQRDKGKAILLDLRRRAPGWTRRQRYARQLSRQLAETYKRTVPADVRELCAFVGVAPELGS